MKERLRRWQHKYAFEYHGGDQFRYTKDVLKAGPIAIPLADVFAGIK